MADQENLEQELRDERARRRDAEQRLEELTERADLWRQRAEERTERIERLLEAQRRKTNTLRLWIKGLTGGDNGVLPSTNEPTGAEPTLEPRRPRWPSSKATIAMTVVADRGISRAVSTFDETPLRSARDSDLDRADLVIVEPAAVRSLDAATRDRLIEWSSREGRQPLVVWASDDDLSAVDGLRSPEDVVVASDRVVSERLGLDHLPGSFDPAEHHPAAGSETRAELLDPTAPDIDVIEAAASGAGFGREPGSRTAARRWAYRHHAPWVRGKELIELAGIRGRHPVPAIAALLISHRPEDLGSALSALLRQTHRPLELVIGLHGAEATPEIEELLSATDIPAKTLAFDPELTLGECLNLAAAHTTAPLLAKIDDDDHYGPAHLEDSFHALCYSGADIVGKGTHYTYMAKDDQTVLRHPGMEETFIDGSPNGATLVFRRETWEPVGFPRRPRHVDTGFLRGARGLGSAVYAGSRWEFCYVRRPEGHTWDAESSVFTAGSEEAWDGFHPERVEVSDVEPF